MMYGSMTTKETDVATKLSVVQEKGQVTIPTDIRKKGRCALNRECPRQERSQSNAGLGRIPLATKPEELRWTRSTYFAPTWTVQQGARSDKAILGCIVGRSSATAATSVVNPLVHAKAPPSIGAGRPRRPWSRS